MSPTTCVILAAGASQRLGRPKQLERLPSGRTLLEHAVATARAAEVERVIVVLGANATALQDHVAGADVITNTRWEEGQATSLVAGVEASDASHAALVTTCDQPRVTAADLRSLVDAVTDATPVAAAGYAGTVGVPACFGPAVRSQLLSRTGDEGAKSVLRAATHLNVINMPNAAFDVDTPADAAELACSITVKLFGPQAKLAGAREVQVELARPATAGDVLAALAGHVPALAASMASSRLAVNKAFAQPADPVDPADEVALIGMISGG